MATSSGLPGRILSRLWRVISWPLVFLADVTIFGGWLGDGFGGRKPKGFWSEARTGHTKRPRRPKAPSPDTERPAPPPTDLGYFGEGDA